MRFSKVLVNPVEDIPGVFSSINSDLCEFGVIPIENSVSGTMHEGYELLMRHPTIKVVGEIALYHEHCLLALPGVALADIRQVISHPHILQQCRPHLASLPSPAISRSVANTIAACQMLVDDKLADAAVIASHAAGALYKLNLLASDISSPAGMVTRYMVLSKTSAQVEHAADRLKCSIAVTMSNTPGMLFKIIAAFALREVNIAKFDCAPAPAYRLKPDTSFDQPFFWQYVFYIDFEPTSPSLSQLIIANLEEFATVQQFGLYRQQSLPLTSKQPDWNSFLI